jgi:hypothetical protein
VLNLCYVIYNHVNYNRFLLFTIFEAMKRVSTVLFTTEMLFGKTLTVLSILLGWFQWKAEISEIFYIDLLDFGTEFALFLQRTLCIRYIAFGFIRIDFNDLTLHCSWW